jgi:hypothetical protein
MISITADLIDIYEYPPHFKVFDFLKIYLVQPWMADQYIEDVRIEEKISSRELELTSSLFLSYKNLMVRLITI